MEEDEIMPKSNDRKRVKDRIIEGIAKAVKHIQTYQLSQVGEEQSIILRNSDWQFHKLVENLDHAFLYGLRHFTDGYWVIVQEFTHRSTIDDIMKMSNITTNLGRSRAWLHVALSDHLLESYVLCFIKNADIVRKHYVRDALVLDEQRLQLLLTLSSGLDLIAFDLEVNVQYLDLCSHLRVRTDSQEEDDDNISLCSMISSQSQHSSMEETNHFRLNISPLSMLTNFIKPLTAKQTAPSLTSEETEEEKILRIESFANTTPPVVSYPAESTTDIPVNGEVEVIRVKTKRHHAKRGRDRMKSPSVPDSDRSSLVSVDSSACLSPISSESGYRSVPEDSVYVQCNDGGNNVVDSVPSSSGETVTESPKSPSKELEDIGKMKRDLSEEERLLNILEGEPCDQVPVSKVCFNQTIEWKSTDVPPKAADRHSPASATGTSSQSLETFNELSLTSPSSDSKQFHTARQNHVDDDKECFLSVDNAVSMDLVSSVEEPSIYDGDSLPVIGEKIDVKSSSELPTEDLAEHVLMSLSLELSQAETPPSSATPASTAEDLEGEQSSSANEAESSMDCDVQTKHVNEIEVDNNLQVVLMLDVFLHDEEVLVKMFRTCQGHTEGEIIVTYVVITSHSLYLLRSSSRPNKFVREIAINYKDLDYISISLNYQIIHIVCRIRHNQFWLTTGDEALTRLIVSHLSNAVLVRDDNVKPSLSSPTLSVLTDATAQKISISKWLSDELDVQREDVSLLNYALVHWEDSEAVKCGDLRLSLGHEGFLFYKVYTANYLFAGASWNRSYFVLDQGVLHQYADKNSLGTPQKSVSLTPDQCHGCRRCPDSDRKHSFEILLAYGATLELSASSEAELQDWLIRLCQATCDQTGNRATQFGCVACCSVVTQSHLLMCHEDLQTNFLRTLGCLPIASITRILTDADSTTYCVLAWKKQLNFASQEELWCIYFYSSPEQQKFVKSLSDASFRLKKSVLDVSPVDAKLSKRCRTGIAKLSELHKGGMV